MENMPSVQQEVIYAMQPSLAPVENSTTPARFGARAYCETIADELHALEIVTAGAPYGYDHDRPEYDDDDAATYRAALATLEINYEQADDALATYLNETALDLSILRDNTGRARIEILRTCGGPRCEITRDTHYDGEQLTVTTWDHPNTASVTVWAPTLAAYLDEIAEAHA